PLQEAIREASSGGSDVDTDTPAHGHAEVVQRVRELLATATDVWRPAANLDLGGGLDQRARLVDPATVDEDLPGEDATGGALATGEEGLFHEEFVETNARCHDIDYRRRILGGLRRKSRTTPATKPPMWANQATPPPSAAFPA